MTKVWVSESLRPTLDLQVEYNPSVIAEFGATPPDEVVIPLRDVPDRLLGLWSNARLALDRAERAITDHLHSEAKEGRVGASAIMDG